MTLSARTFWKHLTRLHRYAGLVLGLQIILWFGSGFFMTLFPIEQVRGNHMLQSLATPAQIATIDLEAISKSHSGDIETLEAANIAGRLVVSVNGDAHYSADGSALAPLQEDAVRTVARAAYAGVGELGSLALLDEVPLDYRGAVPVWQAKFEDAAATRLYIAPDTGEVLRVRTRLWRVFDTMWMLHIMDYGERENFSSWHLRILSFFALLFAISGMMLAVQRVFLRPKPDRGIRTRA